MTGLHVPAIERSSSLTAHWHTKSRGGSWQLKHRAWAVPCSCSSKRVPKDPRMFRSLEDLRAALHSRDSRSPGFIAGWLNQISRDAFGSERHVAHPSTPVPSTVWAACAQQHFA